jgi:hypothetical protein
MRLVMIVAVVCLGMVGACDDSGDCDHFCKEGNACEATTDDDVECEEFCDGVATIKKTDCGAEYDDLLKCYQDADDLCVEGTCKDELNAFGFCALVYCGNAFDKPGCDEIRDGLSS